MSDTLTAEQIAERWGCDPSTIRRMRHDGRLPAPVPSPLQRNTRWRVADIVIYEQSMEAIIDTESRLTALLATVTDKTARDVAEITRRIVGDVSVYPPVRAAVGHLVGRMNLDRANEWTHHDRNRARRILLQLAELAGEIAGEKEGEANVNSNE